MTWLFSVGSIVGFFSAIYNFALPRLQVKKGSFHALVAFVDLLPAVVPDCSHCGFETEGSTATFNTDSGFCLWLRRRRRLSLGGLRASHAILSGPCGRQS